MNGGASVNLPVWFWGIIVAIILGLPTYSYTRLQGQVDRIEVSVNSIGRDYSAEMAQLRTDLAVLRVQVNLLLLETPRRS